MAGSRLFRLSSLLLSSCLSFVQVDCFSGAVVWVWLCRRLWWTFKMGLKIIGTFSGWSWQIYLIPKCLTEYLLLCISLFFMAALDLFWHFTQYSAWLWDLWNLSLHQNAHLFRFVYKDITDFYELAHQRDTTVLAVVLRSTLTWPSLLRSLDIHCLYWVMSFAVSCYYSGSVQFVYRDQFHVTPWDEYSDCVCLGGGWSDR